MDIKDSIHAKLVNAQLSTQEATTILDMAKHSRTLPRHLKWGYPPDNYSYEWMDALWDTIKKVALAWIAQNNPEHNAISQLQ